MRESYREGVANHSGPEPCEGGGNVALEALDRGICRLGIELRNLVASGSRRCQPARKATLRSHENASEAQSRGVEDPRHAEKLHAREPGDPVAARRKCAGREERAMSHKSSMHGGGESYSGIVPAKQPNKSGQPPAEAVEGRPLTKENTPEPNSYRTPSRESGRSGLERVREAARKDGKLKFTALLHHVSIDLLRKSYYSLKKKAAPGVDGLKWGEYGRDLEARPAGGPPATVLRRGD